MLSDIGTDFGFGMAVALEGYEPRTTAKPTNERIV